MKTSFTRAATFRQLQLRTQIAGGVRSVIWKINLLSDGFQRNMFWLYWNWIASRRYICPEASGSVQTWNRLRKKNIFFFFDSFYRINFRLTLQWIHIYDDYFNKREFPRKICIQCSIHTQGQSWRGNASSRNAKPPSSLFRSSHFRLNRCLPKDFSATLQVLRFMSDAGRSVAIRNAAGWADFAFFHRSGQFREISLILMVLKKFVCFSQSCTPRRNNKRSELTARNARRNVQNFFSSNTLSIKKKLVKEIFYEVTGAREWVAQLKKRRNGKTKKL